MSKTLITSLAICACLVASCGSKNMAGGCISLASGMCSAPADGQRIPFTEMRRYFVRNDVKGLPPVMIDTDSALNANFGMATVMGEGGRPTAVDFSREFCISVALPETDIYTEILPLSLSKDADGVLTFSYSVSRGKRQTYTMQPQILVKVARKYYGDVRLREVKQKVE